MLTDSDVAHFAPLRLIGGECQAYMTVSQQTGSIVCVKILFKTLSNIFSCIKFLKLEETKKKNPLEIPSLFKPSSAHGDCQLAQC